MTKRMSVLSFTFILVVVASRGALAGSISQAKMLPDTEQQIVLASRIVTFIGSDYFYIVDDGRECGIRVQNAAHGLTVGMRADVTGTIQTNSNYERYISATSATQSGSGTVDPIYMNNKTLGGADWRVVGTGGQRGMSDYPLGLNNVGLLVRVQGRVMDGAQGDTGSFQIDDDTQVFVEVASWSGTTFPGYGGVVAVTGVLSCVNERQQISGPASPTYRDFIRRVVIPRDVQVISPAPTLRYAGEMRLVAAGSFLMGTSGVGDDIYGYSDESPQHTVYLPSYRIGKYEVTRGEYTLFKNAGGYLPGPGNTKNPYWSDEGWQWKLANNRTQPSYWGAVQNWGSPPGAFVQTNSHPVIGVSYYEAEAFCNWAGVRLLTQAEWEKAARWDGHPRIYPWGDSWSAGKCNNWGDSLYPGYQTAPVGQYPSGASFYGCYDMVGNVWEWCKDWYSSTYYAQTPLGGWLSPQGPLSGKYCTLGVGEWDYVYDGEDFSARCAYRGLRTPGYDSDKNGGFRVAQ